MNPHALTAHQLSIVVPMYNEVENVDPLVARVHEVLADYPWPWELILVDDGSSDETASAIRAASLALGSHVRAIELARNFRQTAATQAGVDASRGDVIVTMDGDLQNDPIDIPRMVARLLNEDLDLVAGWRKDRQDDLLMRKIPSRIANRLIARLTGVHLRDYGCSLKVFRASVLKKLRLYGEMHRFIPAWLSTVTTPRRIAQEVVVHHPRLRGVSKYGISRTFRVLLDLVFVYFFMRFRSQPGHFFGGIGIMLGGSGMAILTYLLALKVFFAESIGTRPLLFAGFFLLVAGVQMVTSGILAEVLARVFFESGSTRSYFLRNDPSLPDAEGWHQQAKPAAPTDSAAH